VSARPFSAREAWADLAAVLAWLAAFGLFRLAGVGVLPLVPPQASSFRRPARVGRADRGGPGAVEVLAGEGPVERLGADGELVLTAERRRSPPRRLGRALTSQFRRRQRRRFFGCSSCAGSSPSRICLASCSACDHIASMERATSESVDVAPTRNASGAPSPSGSIIRYRRPPGQETDSRARWSERSALMSFTSSATATKCSSLSV
jgi:hypothetical protein